MEIDCGICDKSIKHEPTRKANIVICGHCAQILNNKGKDVAATEIKALVRSGKHYISKKIDAVMGFYGLTQFMLRDKGVFEGFNKINKLQEGKIPVTV